MSAWDLTCRPQKATTTTATTTTTTELQHQLRSSQASGRQNDRLLAKLRDHHHQQQVITTSPIQRAKFVISQGNDNLPAPPLASWLNSNPTPSMPNAANHELKLQPLLTTANTQLDSSSNYRASLSQMAWLEALRKQDLARQSMGAVSRNGTASMVADASASNNLTATALSLNPQYNSGPQSSLPSSLSSSSPGSSSSRSGSTESVDLSLTKFLMIPHVEAARNPFSNSSSVSPLSLSSNASTSSTSLSSTNSFDGDYTITSAASCCDVNAAKDCRTDRRARKKDQNRRAAYNYRRKKMEERDRMIEEEARLVHRHVRLAGKIARLEEKILTLLSSKTRRVSDTDGFLVCHLCPVCMKTYVNIQTLRNHMKIQHYQQILLNNDEKAPWASLGGASVATREEGGFDVDNDNDEDDGDDDDGYPHKSEALNCKSDVKYSMFNGGDIEYDDKTNNNTGDNNEDDSSPF